MIIQGPKNFGRFSKPAKILFFQVLEWFHKANRVNIFTLISLVTKLRLGFKWLSQDKTARQYFLTVWKYWSTEYRICRIQPAMA